MVGRLVTDMEHYFLERIVSIAIYLVVNFVILIGIAKSKTDYKKLKIWMIVYVVLMCAMAFFFIPNQSLDLTRLRVVVNKSYLGMNFEKYIEMLGTTSTYTTHTFYYLVAKTGVIELLSVGACLISLSSICYILYDYAKRKKIKGSAVAVALLFYISIGAYFEVICGLRSMCAFSIFVFCVYREFFQGKSVLSNLLFYAVAIGFHNAVVPIVIFRFVFLLFQKEDKIVKKIFNYIIFGLLIVFAIRFGSNIIDATTSKAQNYMENEIYSYIWNYIIGVLTICNLAYLFFVNRKTLKQEIPRNYNLMVIIFMLLNSLSIFTDFNIFWRYTWVLTMLSLPMIMDSFGCQSIQSGSYAMKKQNVVFYILLFSMLLIGITRGDLCALRFFTFS